MSEFVRKFVHSGVIASSKLARGLALAKLLAIYGGPTGFAQFAQFQNLVQVGGGIAGGGIGQGLIRHLAENEDRKHRQRYLAAGFSLGIALTMLAVGIVLLIGFFVGERLFATDAFAWSVLAAVALCVVSIMNLTMSSLNGLGKSGWMAWGQGIGALVTVGAAWWFMHNWGALGAGIGMVLGGVAAGGVALAGIHGLGYWIAVKAFWRREHAAERRSLLGYLLMSLAASVSMPVVLMVVRSALGKQVSWDVAGQWSALWRLSEAYLLVFVTLMSIYYLPRLAAAREKQDVYREIRLALIRFVPLVTLTSFLVYFFRHKIIGIALSSDFGLVAELMPLQLFGDVIKIVAWIFGNYMWAKGHTTAFIVSELSLSWLYGGGCLLAIHLGYGAEGCVAMFLITCIIATGGYYWWIVIST